MCWINSRKPLTPHSLARHPVQWVQTLSSFSLYLSYQNSHVFLAFLRSLFLCGLLELLLPHLFLLLPLPCLFLFLETFPSPLWLRLSATQLMALGPQPAADGSMWAQMNNSFFQCSSLGCSFGEALPCTTFRDRDTVFVAQSRARHLTDTWEAIVLTKGSTAGSSLLLRSLEEWVGDVQRKWDMLVETKFVY